jgi:hypothetical protein
MWHIVTALCVVGLTGVSVYRAATQAITHDEAVTCERYVSGPLYRLVSSTDANNHIVHSLLCRLSASLFGVSEFTLRLPSVVAGLLFLALIARIGSRVWGSSPATPVAVLLLGLNPFVLDYLSAARGYSLALMFWVAALDRLLAAAQEPGSWAKAAVPNLQLRRASQYLALAVLANLTFALAAVALVACWGFWAWGERRRQAEESPAQTRAWFWHNLGRPGAIVFACLALPLVKLRPGSFYFGATNFPDSLRSLVFASFAHHPQSWPADNGTGWYLGLLDCLALTVIPALTLTLVALWVVTAAALSRRWTTERCPPEPGVMLFHLSAGTLTLTLGLLAGLHAVGMKLPLERTGLYLLPPFGLAFLSAGAGLASIRTWPLLSARLGTGLSRAALSAGVLLCLVWGSQVQTSHYRPWLYDSDSRAVFRAIVALHDPSSKRLIRVGATWALAPSLNFYRNQYRADFVERIQRRADYPPDADLYVIATAVGGTPPPEPVVVLYHNPVTGTTIAAPARGRPTTSAGD